MHRLHEVERIEMRAQRGPQENAGDYAHFRLVLLGQLGESGLIALPGPSEQNGKGVVLV
jgi:hypothetical protein